MIAQRLTLITLLCMCALNCSNEEDVSQLTVGEDFTDSNVRVIRIDTFSVDLATYKLDSIVTSGSERLLFGQYNDPYLGKVKATPYFELSSSNYAIASNAILDSVAFILKYDSYFHNDTTKVMHINLHALNDFVRPKDANFYNTSKISYTATPIATKAFYPKPSRDSLHVSIPYEYGSTLFQSLKKDISNTEELLQEVKGFTLQPDASDDGAIIGFSNASSSTYLRFYYRLPDEFDTNTTYDLYITADSSIPKYFNNITSDVSGTSLAQLLDQDESLSSINSNHQSYFQSGVGYVTKIKLPTLRDLYNIEGKGTVLNATLQLKPKASSYTDNIKLKESFNLFYVDQNNLTIEQVYSAETELVATLVSTSTEFKDVYYNVPILEYIDRKLVQSPLINDALILYTSDYNKTLDRVIFSDRFENNSAKLILTYAIYDAN